MLFFWFTNYLPNFYHSKFTALSAHTHTHTELLSYDFPQALGTECKSRQNSSGSTIHLSTGLLGRKKEERERVSINHLTPGYIYAHSNEFNKESSPWSNILSGTSSLSPSSTPSSFYPPSYSSSSSLRRLLIVKWQRMLHRADRGEEKDRDTRLTSLC